MFNFLNFMFAEKPADWAWVKDVRDAIISILWPALIIVGAAGMIYAIVLGINMARADTTEKREEAKKRVVNVLVGLAIIIALILFFLLFISDGGILEQIMPQLKD